MKIISFHFAGGNQYSFNKIFQHYKNYTSFELKRHTYGLEKEVEDFVCLLKELLTEGTTYAIYGHSMGALLGYLVCQKLQEEKLPLPQKLIVSGKKALNIPREKKIAHLSDEDFWNEIIDLGGTPSEVKNYPELLNYYLPILRHDFKLVENYQYEKNVPLNIPIDVFYGSQEATEEEMAGWHDESTQKVTITLLPGNHFFIFDHVEYFKNYFENLIYKK
ncbi:hypothetical protein IQ37_04745 [Chryseobacterium piperi]|uniref:Thioesterase domain-containing protein n=1 Tax=Chryseobacterium piperi TaxID=558152 RepID=A0A086BKS3_9FLAO|nr:thioesterase domain-containing protein [Chryseobacterium piperi]ASW74376.1 thioesterase [Chryseobacterium piperi]KFF29537.1 hypothetical protein IQ37_04745 [Chryseobacterium piperi]